MRFTGTEVSEIVQNVLTAVLNSPNTQGCQPVSVMITQNVEGTVTYTDVTLKNKETGKAWKAELVVLGEKEDDE